MEVLTLEKFGEILKECNLVVVVGMPCAGKSVVAQALHDSVLGNHSFYKSDDYIDYGYEQSLYAMVKDMSYDQNPRKLVEGVQGYRFLRKMQQTEGMTVDAVVNVTCDDSERARRYEERGKGNLPRPFERNLTTVYMDYINKLPHSNMKIPRFFQFDTTNGMHVISEVK